MSMSQLYTFRAQILNIVDGDTLDAMLDCGFSTYRFERLRLLGVNTPELHSKVKAERDAATKATEWLKAKFGILGHGDNALASFGDASQWNAFIRTEKKDSFGRWLATIWCGVDDWSINRLILDEGIGTIYKRKARK